MSNPPRLHHSQRQEPREGDGANSKSDDTPDSKRSRSMDSKALRDKAKQDERLEQDLRDRALAKEGKDRKEKSLDPAKRRERSDTVWSALSAAHATGHAARASACFRWPEPRNQAAAVGGAGGRPPQGRPADRHTRRSP